MKHLSMFRDYIPRVLIPAAGSHGPLRYLYCASGIQIKCQSLLLLIFGETFNRKYTPNSIHNSRCKHFIHKLCFRYRAHWWLVGGRHHFSRCRWRSTQSPVSMVTACILCVYWMCIGVSTWIYKTSEKRVCRNSIGTFIGSSKITLNTP